jgi:hypothetical protein
MSTRHQAPSSYGENIDVALCAAVEAAALGRGLRRLDLNDHEFVVRCLGARLEALADAACEALQGVVDGHSVDLERLRVVVDGGAVPRGES